MSDTPTSLDTITIRTDQGPLSLPADSTLAEAVQQLLAAQGKADDSVATAVNGHFVARGQRMQHRLRDGDTVLCFSPITGG
ncbi:MoaD/ThiS family protein [Aquabacterium soli]|uniref:MoaD/ThiS family protein n=1 Tax=Aquabacterium soli TaxID=2493092 RepID=A0A426VH62_9BURK|nr:MoaD/ThiS family protein [Aquabacterium soli]RRS06247.1 MoaD/ThiS family protein [Aquabacterium soli]